MHIQEGSFTVIRGKQRAGKTLAMSLFAHSDYEKGRSIFTNLAYQFDYTPLYFQELDLNDAEVIEQIRESSITLDEMWMLFDARSSATSESKKFSRWLYQVKKLGVNLYGTTHEVDMLDKRARNNFDWLIDVQVLPKQRAVGEPPRAILLHIQNGPLQSPVSVKRVLELKPEMLGLYDTGNVFDPLAPPPGWELRKKRHSVEKEGYKASAPYEYVPTGFLPVSAGDDFSF